MNIVSTIVPIFIVIFVGMVAKQQGFFTPEGISFFKSVGKFLILMGMVGIGFGTDFALTANGMPIREIINYSSLVGTGFFPHAT